MELDPVTPALGSSLPAEARFLAPTPPPPAPVAEHGPTPIRLVHCTSQGAASPATPASPAAPLSPHAAAAPLPAALPLDNTGGFSAIFACSGGGYLVIKQRVQLRHERAAAARFSPFYRQQVARARRGGSLLQVQQPQGVAAPGAWLMHAATQGGQLNATASLAPPLPAPAAEHALWQSVGPLGAEEEQPCSDSGASTTSSYASALRPPPTLAD